MPNSDNRRHGTAPGMLGDGAEDIGFTLATAGEAALAGDPGISGGAPANSQASGTRDTETVQQIVFIDASVQDAQLLAAGVAPGVRSVILEAGSDGVAQIAAYLTSHDISGLTAIDIVAHGRDGQIALGNGLLSADTIAQYQTELAAIGAALRPGGDIQIYGCDVAQDAAGVAFLDQLSAATGGASIAAASHLVGAAAAGGSWSLDINVGAPVVTADPFTATAEAAYPDLLVTTSNQLYDVFNTNSTATKASTRVQQFGVSNNASIIAGTTIVNATVTTGVELYGLAIDAPLGKYFITIYDFPTNQILVGNLSGGTPTVLYDKPASDVAGNFYELDGLALDQAGGQLYFAQSETDSTGAVPLAGQSGIYKISVNGGAETVVVSGALYPESLALDVPDNIVFFTDFLFDPAANNNLDAGSLSGSKAQVLNSQLAGLGGGGSALSSVLASKAAALSGVDVNTATKTIYFTGFDSSSGSATANNFIDSVKYTVSGATVTLTPGTLTTLYSGAGAGRPQSIAIDAQNGIFYVTNQVTEVIQVGSLAHTGAGSVTTVYTDAAIATSNQADFFPTGLVVLSTPTIVASGTVTYVQAATAIAVDSTLTLSNSDGQGLASGTVKITNGTTNDVLSATTTGTSITASYTAATETLTLSGADTLAHYQTVLDSVKFSSTGTVGARTINYTVTDGVITSATPTTTVNVASRATIAAGATVSFTGGGAAVILDSGLTVTDPGSATLASATVAIGGFQTGDTLTVGTPGGLGSSFSGGTLTLSGSGSLATYQTALQSVAYGTSPANTDPTAGGSQLSRTISWLVNDGTVTSGAVTSLLNEVHVAGTITTAGTVSYTGTPVVIDSTVTVTDVDSGGNLTAAAVKIGNFLAGDTLQFTNQNGIVGSFSAGTLALTGTATLANYQTALDSVKFATTSATQSIRTINWTVSDSASTSSPSSSSVNVICFGVGTLIGVPGGEVQVEKLKAGDLVLTADNGPRAVTWIGKGKVLSTRGKRTAATPVIVRKGALGENMPNQDLHVTKAHSFYIDGVLIPVEFLVNHRTIIWDDRAQEVEIYHVELASHDVLIANGAPAESYRDDGNRWLFQNGNERWGMPAQQPYAQVLTGGPVVDEVWARLLDRAGPRNLPPMTGDADVHLIVDGQRVDAMEVQGLVRVFRLSGRPESVHLASREVVPAELGIARDPRSLGVALRRMAVRQGSRFDVLLANDARLTEGFHAYEEAANLRWTDGLAGLPVDAFAQFSGEVEVVLTLAGTTNYPLIGSESVAA